MSDRNIDETNVDFAIRDALKRYSEIGMLVDLMFWNHCLGLLQKKYGFKLETKKASKK